MNIAALLSKSAKTFRHRPALALGNKVISSYEDTGQRVAKLAGGMADDALGCIVLALNIDAALIVAPALNGKMWQHPATQANVRVLTERGVQIVGPADGDLACGYEGLGRLAPVEEITTAALQAVGLAS
mgnify:CR=1 FL=1